MNDRTHWDGCWLQGAEHYECAVTRIRTLERDVKAWIDMAHGQRKKLEEVRGERDRLREAIEDSLNLLPRDRHEIRAILRAALEDKP